MSNHALVPFRVIHKRSAPKKYEFTHDFFWFKVDLFSKESWPSFLVSHNKFNLYSFLDYDHLKIGGKSALDNYRKFAKDNGVDEEITGAVIYTQMRFLNYVFNPVSFVLLEDSLGSQYCIVEIGNTFNEQKPFFVDCKHFKEDGFTFKTKKLFYISPFIPHDNDMTFVLKLKDKKISIYIDDQSKEERILQVWLDGEHLEANTRNLLWQTFKVPFVTFKTIFLIHLHAFVLWSKKIKYLKKSENQDLQQGKVLWKTSKLK